MNGLNGKSNASVKLANNILACQGTWSVSRIADIQTFSKKLTHINQQEFTIDGQAIEHMDTAGAWILQKFAQQLIRQDNKVTFVHFNEKQQALLKLIEQQLIKIAKLPQKCKETFLYNVGTKSYDFYKRLFDMCHFVGEVFLTLLYNLIKPHRLRFKAILSTIELTGFNALPIIALLSFLIGIVLAYQMGLQLQPYGANIFIVDLLGLSILREFAPFITAIIIAGRSGSAFTAQIGTMIVNQEVDALRTFGVSPVETLILPRIIGLIIALPLLSVWASIFGVLGGMLIAKHLLSIDYMIFLQRFQTAIPLKQFIIGLIKTPVFATIIANVGCYHGMKVSSNAASVGTNTTKSVVKSIFLIIIADALFSILFSWQHF